LRLACLAIAALMAPITGDGEREFPSRHWLFATRRHFQ
jgi:hypothetical protein